MGICTSENSNLKHSNTLKKSKTLYNTKKPQLFHINNDISNKDLKQLIEIFITLHNINHYIGDIQVKLLICNNKSMGIKEEILLTEPRSGDEISFNKTTITEYFFEKEQILYLSLLDSKGNILLSDNFTLGRLMGSRKSCLKLEYDNYNIELFGKSVNGFDKKFLFNVSFNLHQNMTKSNSGPYFYCIKNFNDGISWRDTYSSEEKQENNPTYDKVEIESNFCNNGNESQKIRFEIHNGRGEIGYIEKSIIEIKNSVTFNLLSSENDSETDSLIFINVKINEIFNFVELLNKGLQINLAFAIDFTSSNGDPFTKESLHSIISKTETPYESAISSCGSIVAYYDYDQNFPLFGFGGRLKDDIKVSHCFALNGNISDPEIHGIDEVISFYKKALNNVTLSGPTNFSEVIRKVNSIVREILNKGCNSNYHILMIITDGLISDMETTIDEIVESAKLPISIIIIGVGNADFYNMNILDGDDIPLKNSKNEIVERDIVQFVPYNKFKGDKAKLSEEVLQEIPRQIEEYYLKYEINTN